MNLFPNHLSTMKHLFLTIICLINFSISAQTNTEKASFEPTVLILSPNKTSHEKIFNKEISDFNNSILKNENQAEEKAYLTSLEFLSEPLNMQQMIKSEIDYSKDLDFYKQACLIIEQFLAYRFIEKFPNLLILLKDEKSNGSIKGLNKISRNESLRYVLNISSIDIYKEANISYAKIKIQLYDQITNSILLEKSYIGDWNNPGFEFACENQTISCTLNNALSQILNEVIYTIASNNPTLIREKQLQQERFEVLMNNYLTYDINKQSLSKIFLDSDIDIDKAYQTLFNDDQTKFVAFFLEQVSSQNLKTLTETKKDNNVKIISSNDIKDEEFFSEIPKSYAYVIKGVKYNDRWYYEKESVTYFEANTIEDGQKTYFNNLQNWNFFKENSTKFNSEFWETKLFVKVSDLKKDPDWEEYGESIWATEELNNRDFIGLYEIVANTLRKENQDKNSVFEREIKERVFSPKYQLLKDTQPAIYSKLAEHSLLYSKERKVAINPVLVTDEIGVKTIHYFAAFLESPDLFEWTYYKPHQVKGDLFGSEVIEQISSLTEWSFSVDNLNDEDFWNAFVLLKTDDVYSYLKVINQDNIALTEPKAFQEKSTKSIYNNKVLYLIDGKEASQEKIEKIEPNDIETITVIKNKDEISKYTANNYDGVVLIDMKKKKEKELNKN